MCGIFGKIARKKTKFEVDKFSVLGVLNDERGGDSTGVFIDGQLEIGVDKQKLYIDFLHESKLIKDTKTAKIALGHTRKASIGGISKENAQPVCIYNEEGEVEFVLLHNGTIFNYLDLAKKYIPYIDIKGFTDTKVMAFIFYYCGYEVLSEYEGAAAMVIIDYRVEDGKDPIIYMYKGASAKYRYSTTIEEERPLYLTIDKNELWFSSIGKILDAISYPLTSLTLKANTLVKVSLGEEISLVGVTEFDRSSKFQYKSAYEYNNEYNYGQYGGGKYVGTYNKNKNINQLKAPENDKTGSKQDVKGKYENNHQQLWIDNDRDYIPNRITIHTDGLYYINNKLAHGEYYSDFFGYAQRERQINFPIENYFFFQGRLLPNENAYNTLNNIIEMHDMSAAQFALRFAECVDKYGYIPIINITGFDPISVEVYEQEDFDTTRLFNGKLRTMFSYINFVYDVKDGIIIKKEINHNNSKTREYFQIFENLWDEQCVDWDSEMNDLNNYILSRKK